MTHGVAVPPLSAPNDMPKTYTLKSWLLTDDHHRVAILYALSISVFLMLGGLAAAVLRVELLTPPADVLPTAVFKRLLTTHGLLMTFLGLVPAIPAVFGTWRLPSMIGAKNMAWPRLTLLSWYLYVLGGLAMLAALLRGGLEIGWTLNIYMGRYEVAPLLLTAASLALVGGAMILLAINFVTTVHKMRAPGMLWGRLPLFVWAMYVTSLLVLLGTPLLFSALLFALVEAGLNVGIFDPALGGDPILYQHLFWFYANLLPYLMLLPAAGLLFEVFATFAHRPVFGYRRIVLAFFAIAGLSLTSWATHMTIGGISPGLALFASLQTMLLVVPLLVLIFSLVVTLYKGDIRFASPLWFGMAAGALLTVAVLAGQMLAVPTLNTGLDSSLFQSAQWHCWVSAVVLSGLAGVHLYWPRLTGRAYPEFLAKAAAGIIFVGLALSYFPQFVAGTIGLPRLLHSYPEEFFVWQTATSLGTSILFLGYALPLVYFLGSLFWGRRVEDPWSVAETPSTDAAAVVRG